MDNKMKITVWEEDGDFLAELYDSTGTMLMQASIMKRDLPKFFVTLSKSPDADKFEVKME